MRFENTSGNHSKFYEIEVQPGPDDTFRVFTTWGPMQKRFGLLNKTMDNPQVKHKVIYEGKIDGCMKAVEKKRKDRLRHGYTLVD